MKSLRKWIGANAPMDYWHRIVSIMDDHRLGHELDRHESKLIEDYNKRPIRRIEE